MYAIQVDEAIRDEVVADLKKNGIDTRRPFPRTHIQKYHQEQLGDQNEDLPVRWTAWKRLINLPIWPSLSEDQIDYVAEKLVAALGPFRAGEYTGMK